MTAPTLRLTRFTKLGQVGDYQHEIQNTDESMFFFFPDNTKETGRSGAACIRGHSRAIGVPTIMNDESVRRPFTDIIEAMPYVEEAIDERIPDCYVREGFTFSLPVCDERMKLPDGRVIPVLGCGTYDVPLDVRKYITLKIFLHLKKYSRNGDVNIVEV